MKKQRRLMKKRKTKRFKSGCLFNSYFEERKTYNYLSNLISSKLLRSKPEELFNFSCSVLGQKKIISFLEDLCPELKEDEEFQEWIEYDRLDDNLPYPIISELLRQSIQPLLAKKVDTFSEKGNSETEKRLHHLQKVFRLNWEELQIIEFFFFEETCQVIDEYLGCASLEDFTDLTTFRSHGHALLGLKRGPFMKAFTKGNLFESDILKKERSLGISSWCIDYLSGIGEEDIAHEFFTKKNNEPLTIGDFEIKEDELDVLDCVMKSKTGQNILFYGAPGTGKSSFARALSKKHDKELYTVKIPNDDDHRNRLKYILATSNLASKRASIILIDEADEVLNSCQSFFFKSKINKSWINNFLETHDKKIIWITNRSSEIDRSTMRRFSFSIKFKAFNSSRRLKVLKYELAQKALDDYFDEDDLKHLCKTYNVDAGGIVNAISTLKITRRMKKETALRKIKTVLQNHEKATGCKEKSKSKDRTFGSYSLDGLNTSHDLTGIVSVMKRFVNHEKNHRLRNIPSITALLHGMSGTGKTEFVYYLGNMLGKEVLLKRCSDIQSMWVGGTEQNIASAFMEAQENDCILFFDEADSFLFPRKEANHSWEINATNEILTQIENHKGIAIFATNNIEGLDHAALRRFRFKIEFRPLTPDGNVRLYDFILRPLMEKGIDLSSTEMDSIKRIRNLTPGDFAVVKDHALFMEPSEITHQMLIDSLMNEVRYKEGNNKVIGFIN